MSSPQVPLLDLKSQYQSMREATLQAIDDSLSSGQWVLGPKVKELEGWIAETVGAKHGVGVASGTDAILLSLKALGCGPGDEVIIPAHTFVSSAVPFARRGAKIVWADIDPDHPPSVLNMPDDDHRAWKLAIAEPAPGAIAAIAVRQKTLQLKGFSLS